MKNKDYNFLLRDGDSIRKLLPVQKIEIRDVINITNMQMPTGQIWWDGIKHNWVTEYGDTIWQLSERLLNSGERAIGLLEPPVSFLQWILDNSK